MCLSFEYPGSARAGPRPGGTRDRCFEDKLPKAIRVFSPIAARSQNNWVISPLVPPRSSLGHQPYCSSLGTVWFISLLFLSHTIWVISPIVFPVFGTARTPLRVPLSPPCRIDRARGLGSVESVKELDLERENSF